MKMRLAQKCSIQKPWKDTHTGDELVDNTITEGDYVIASYDKCYYPGQATERDGKIKLK